MQREVEDSLRRLRTERIDLLQVHWPPADPAAGPPIEEYWGALVRLREQGKIRAAGLSNHAAAALAAAEQAGHVDSLQPPFSLIRRDAAAAELGWCAAHGTGVIVYSPLQAGLLSGAMTAQRVAAMPADDWRSRNPEFAGDRLAANLALAQRLRAVAERHETTAAAVAVAWVLAWPGVTGAIVGARSPAQLDDWTAAGQLQLTGADLDEIATAVRDTGAARPGPPAGSLGRRTRTEPARLLGRDAPRGRAVPGSRCRGEPALDPAAVASGAPGAEAYAHLPNFLVVAARRTSPGQSAGPVATPDPPA